MTSRERETQAAVAALVHRLQNRGDGIGQSATDDELFAREYVTALLGYGWRPVEALRETRSQPAGEGQPVSEETRRRLEEARRWPLRRPRGTGNAPKGARHERRD